MCDCVFAAGSTASLASVSCRLLNLVFCVLCAPLPAMAAGGFVCEFKFEFKFNEAAGEAEEEEQLLHSSSHPPKPEPACGVCFTLWLSVYLSDARVSAHCYPFVCSLC